GRRVRSAGRAAARAGGAEVGGGVARAHARYAPRGARRLDGVLWTEGRHTLAAHRAACGARAGRGVGPCRVAPRTLPEPEPVAASAPAGRHRALIEAPRPADLPAYA